jgi:cell division protein FtsN
MLCKNGDGREGQHESILKRVTYHARETFRQIEASASSGSKKRASPTTSTSPQRQALARLTLDDAEGSVRQQEEGSSKGLLQRVLEGSSTASSATTVPTSTKASPAKKKCLTSPSIPVSNDGLDNAEGNLIVWEGDLIRPTHLQSLQSAPARRQLRVLSLLGQGTFAQVFDCQCLETGNRVALKIVKNKAAYTRQAAVEIDVFRALSQLDHSQSSHKQQHKKGAVDAPGDDDNMSASSSASRRRRTTDIMVQLECYFMYQNHLCLVFEKLGLNLYEVLKRRQFRGLHLSAVQSLLKQAMEGIKDLAQRQIVHCDLKPENMLLSTGADESLLSGIGGIKSPFKKQDPTKPTPGNDTPSTEDTACSLTDEQSITSLQQQQQQQQQEQQEAQDQETTPKIKLIDFGSACFEGHTAHSYIQSRFYRSPEVLIGLPYDSAIDMWSLGCVAAELFLGLPILPGLHEHDQLQRICEMIGSLPDWMLDQG